MANQDEIKQLRDDLFKLTLRVTIVEQRLAAAMWAFRTAIASLLGALAASMGGLFQ